MDAETLNKDEKRLLVLSDGCLECAEVILLRETLRPWVGAPWCSSANQLLKEGERQLRRKLETLPAGPLRIATESVLERVAFDRRWGWQIAAAEMNREEEERRLGELCFRSQNLEPATCCG